MDQFIESTDFQLRNMVEGLEVEEVKIARHTFYFHF